MVCGGHETLASLEIEVDREKGLYGAVMEILSHALSFIKYSTDVALALTQRLLGMDVLYEGCLQVMCDVYVASANVCQSQ